MADLVVVEKFPSLQPPVTSTRRRRLQKERERSIKHPEVDRQYLPGLTSSYTDIIGQWMVTNDLDQFVSLFAYSLLLTHISCYQSNQKGLIKVYSLGWSFNGRQFSTATQFIPELALGWQWRIQHTYSRETKYSLRRTVTQRSRYPGTGKMPGIMREWIYSQSLLPLKQPSTLVTKLTTSGMKRLDRETYCEKDIMWAHFQWKLIANYDIINKCWLLNHDITSTSTWETSIPYSKSCTLLTWHCM